MKKSADAVKEERKLDHEEDGVEKHVGAKPVYRGETTSKTTSPNLNDQITTNNKEEKLLESTRAAMGEVREENDRLRTTLAQIVKDYQSLQMHFFGIMRQDQSNDNKGATEEGKPSPINNNQVEEHHELVSLSLGSGSSAHKKVLEEKANYINGKSVDDGAHDDSMKEEGSLTLGLDCKVETDVSLMSTDNNSSEEITATKEEAATKEETWPPSKTLQNMRRVGDDEVAPQADQIKRARVSVRARCDAPTMNDGCQWRKYGQKTAKGNPCPRAYYRCTVAPGCPVRKQVQRCAEDMSILITTYEGNHSHPLPLSATAMASTTAAAACMLTTGSSASNPAAAVSHPTAAAFPSGLNFSLPDQKQFYLTSPSISPSQPTITLDLTNPSNRLLSTASRSFYSPTNLNFSPLESSNLNYGTHQPYYKSYNSMMALRQSQDQSSLFHSYAQKASADVTRNPLTDTIAKAITSDPNFQSALVAAINSYVAAGGGGGDGPSGGGGGGLKWGEHLNLASMTEAAAASIGHLAGSSSSSRQHLQPGFGSLGSKKAANGSSGDNS